MSLGPPDKVRKLQRTLHAKAKESPNYRFYALYDKVYREDILDWAYRTCKANGGAAGVDEETFEDIESYGRERWLGELSEALRSKSYRTSPIRRVYIPKANGKQRPLGSRRSGTAWRKRQRCWCCRRLTGRAYVGPRPSKQAIRRICQAIREVTTRRWTPNDVERQIALLNRKLEGWANYFSIGTVSKAYRSVDLHTRERLRRWLRDKHKIPGRGTTRYPNQALYHSLGLVRLEVRPRNVPWATA